MIQTKIFLWFLWFLCQHTDKHATTKGFSRVWDRRGSMGKKKKGYLLVEKNGEWGRRELGQRSPWRLLAVRSMDGWRRRAMKLGFPALVSQLTPKTNPYSMDMMVHVAIKCNFFNIPLAKIWNYTQILVNFLPSYIIIIIIIFQNKRIDR